MVGHADRHVGDELIDARVDVVQRGHDVLAATEELRVVVGEDCWHGAKVQPLDGAEREVLGGKPGGHPPRADRFGALGEDRPEALGGSAEDADAGVELVGKTGRGRRERHGDEVIHQRRVELAEVELKIAGEVRGVRLLAGKGRFAIDDEAVCSEQIVEQRRQVAHRRRQVVGLLGTGRRYSRRRGR